MIDNLDHPFALSVVTAFLAGQVTASVAFLWKRSGLRQGWVPVHPVRFLLGSLAVFGLAAAFVAVLGLSRAGLAVVLSAGIALGLSNPTVAVTFFLSCLLLRPWELMPPNALMALIPRLLAVTSLVSWVVHTIRRSGNRVLWTRQCTYYAVFLLWLFLAAFFSDNRDDSIAFFTSSFLPISVAVFLVLNAASLPEEIVLVRRSVQLSVVGVISSAITLTLTNPKFWDVGMRLEGASLSGNSNDLGSLIVMVLPFVVISLLRPPKDPQSRTRAVLGSVLSLFVLLPGLALTQSRGAVLAIAFMVLGYAFVVGQRRAKVAAVALALLLLPVVTLVSMSREAEDVEGSSTSRWVYVLAGARMVKDHPVFGVGLNNYPKYYERYSPAFYEWGQRTAHSTWVLTMAESGLIGLFLFGAFFFSTLSRAWALRKTFPEYFLSMIGYGIAMSFLSHTYLFFPYLLCFLVLAATRSAKISGVMPVVLLLALVVPATFTDSAHAQSIEFFQAAPGGRKPVGREEPITSSKLELMGSRGETLNFLIKMRSAQCVTVRVEPWSGANRMKRAFPVRFFSMPLVETENPSFRGAYVGMHHDPLVPIRDSRFCPDSDPKAGMTWFWGEVDIPRDTRPGLYTTRVQAGAISVAVAMKVWKMTMPEEPVLPGYSELNAWFAVKGHYGQWSHDEAKLQRSYTESMFQHRVVPLNSALSPLKAERKGEANVIDLKNDPNPAKSFATSVLNHRPAWALFDFPTLPPEKILEKPRETDGKIAPTEAEIYFRALESQLSAKQSPIAHPKNAFVHLWEEPVADEDEDVAQAAGKVHDWAPSLRVMVSAPLRKELAEHVDIFVPMAEQFLAKGQADLPAYRMHQKRGGEFWLGVGCMSHGCDSLADSGAPDFTIERDAVYVRSIGWIASLFGATGLFYRSVNHGYQNYPKRDPWKTTWDRTGNGDGTLFYPGRAGERGFTTQEPVPSIRLKLWRESSFDAEYFRWMQELKTIPQWWPQELNRLIQTPLRWSRRYEDYQKLRDRIGETIDQQP